MVVVEHRIVVKTNDVVEYEILKACVKTYEHFTGFSLNAEWEGGSILSKEYTASFMIVGTEEKSEYDRKMDFGDLVDYVTNRNYPA